MEKLIIAYGSCQIINTFYIRHPPEFPSVNPFTPPLGSQNKRLMLNRSPQQHTSLFILQRSDGNDFADQFPQSRQPRCGTASVIPRILGWRGVEGERFMEKIAHLFPGCCRAARLHRVPKIIKWRRRLKGRERQRRQRAGKRTRWKAECGAETLALLLPLTSEDQSQEIKTQAPAWDNNRLSLEQSGCFCWAVCSGGLPWGTAAVLPFDLCLHQIWPSNLVNSFLHSPRPLQSPPALPSPRGHVLVWTTSASGVFGSGRPFKPRFITRTGQENASPFVTSRASPLLSRPHCWAGPAQFWLSAKI